MKAKIILINRFVKNHLSIRNSTTYCKQWSNI